MYNHKYFLMFLVHATIGCFIVMVFMGRFLIEKGIMRGTAHNMHNFAVPIVSASLVVALGGLFGFHCYMILYNQSTLESD